MSDDFQQRGGSPWGTPPGGGGGNGSGKGPTPPDIDKIIREFQEKQAEFEQQASDIKDAAIKRGREKVPKMIMSSLSDKVVSSRYDPYDIKPINHPIDYIIYDGMNKASVENVILLYQKNDNLAQLHKSIHETVENKKYDWKVARK